MKKISVVMPTKNRAVGLKKVIDKLLRQSVHLSDYELIIVDNGSTDNTKQVVNYYVNKHKGHVFYFHCGYGGAAAARNMGAYNSKAEYLLFLDDDMIVDYNIIKNHLKAHEIYNGSILGYFETDWGKGTNLFLEYLKVSGGQNSFPFKDGDLVDYRYFYTGNISVRKKAFEICEGFDEGFKVYGYEDIDLGYRMFISGEKCYFFKKAIAFHDYHPGFKHFLKKRCLSGYSLGYFLEKYPYLSKDFCLGKISFGRYIVVKLFSPFILGFYKSQLSYLKRRCFDMFIGWNVFKGLMKFKRERKTNSLHDLLR